MEEKLKARAIIVDDDNNVILIRYASMYMFPGGSVEQDESIDIALIRELEEELGVSYEQDELTYLTAYEKMQPNYPLPTGEVVDRKLITHYYVLPYKTVNIKRQNLTDMEKQEKFAILKANIEDLAYNFDYVSDNPRADHFKEEMNYIINYYLKEKRK